MPTPLAIISRISTSNTRCVARASQSAHAMPELSTGGFFALRRMTKRSSVSTSTSRPADMWRRSESTSSGESAGISGITSALMVSAAMIREATSQCRTRIRGWWRLRVMVRIPQQLEISQAVFGSGALRRSHSQARAGIISMTPCAPTTWALGARPSHDTCGTTGR